MDRESVDRLRFDRRLERRRGWVEETDKNAHLEALPDVSDKMTRGLDEPDEGEADTEAPAGSPPPAFGQPADSPFSEASSSPAQSPSAETSEAPPSPFGGGGSEFS